MTGQFLSTPSARRATRRWTIVTRLWRFLSTPSARRATMPRGTTPAPPTNFYPRPPRGGRHRQHLPWRTDQDFYPRPPRGGRRSTPRVRGDAADISIHALREEGDTSRSSRRRWWSYFYPRPPRGGRRFSSAARARSKKFLSTPSARRATPPAVARGYPSAKFLSTPSARRATTGRHPVQRRDRHFYPRPPRGGRQQTKRP